MVNRYWALAQLKLWYPEESSDKWAKLTNLDLTKLIDQRIVAKKFKSDLKETKNA